jgi:two-component system phosphate regulon sensor histidine kinase PhoR
MKTQDESKELRFRTHIQDSLPLIEANRLEMEQLFTNLISNAIKYNVKKGWVEISVEVREDFVEVKVSDTGIGIDKEDIPCIFDEFFRVSGPQTRYTTGTGLGLSIVKRIVDAHFGHIEVESEVDKGTTFTVKLPLRVGRQEETGRDGAETARACG